MLRTTTLALLALIAAFGWAHPIANKYGFVGFPDPEINPDLFEGDIVGIDRSKIKPGQEPRNAVRDPELLWPGGIVYYNIGIGFSAQELATLEDTFAQYEAKSCLKFVQRTTEPNFIFVEKTGAGCFSSVGMTGGRQLISLDASCFRCSATGCLSGTPIHEFLHALGFYHEQSRTDRDEYVYVNYTNIQPGYENNFDSYGQDIIQHLGAPYDYGSVLHYGAYGFAIDPTIPTIVAPEGVTIGQRVGFSEVDLFELNTLYNCTAKL